MKRLIFTLFLNLLFSISAFAQGGHKQVSEGNKLFAEEKYDEANNKYRDALIENPESPILHYNLGDVQYKKSNYEEALKSYEKGLSTDDILLQSKSYYNMGNTFYRLGQLPESILAYKKALELKPDDEDAKYNLEYVRAKLKDMAQKQPQQNQQQQQEQQNQEQNQNSSEQEQEQQEQNESETNQNQSEKEQQQQQAEEQEVEQPKEISKEDAERILDALQNEEQELLQKQKARKQGRPFRGKDW